MLRRHLAVEAATEAMKQYKSGLVCQFTEDGGEDNNITPCYDVIINNIMSASVCEYVFSGRKMCSVSAGLCVYVCDRSVSISRFFIWSAPLSSQNVRVEEMNKRAKSNQREQVGNKAMVMCVPVNFVTDRYRHQILFVRDFHINLTR
jgi:hypothetical protein